MNPVGTLFPATPNSRHYSSPPFLSQYEREAPTVVISNLRADELGRAMGDRCVDRLREGGLIVVPFEWERR